MSRGSWNRGRWVNWRMAMRRVLFHKITQSCSRGSHDAILSKEVGLLLFHKPL